jgi:hypothetical protein
MLTHYAFTITSPDNDTPRRLSEFKKKYCSHLLAAAKVNKSNKLYIKGVMKLKRVISPSQIRNELAPVKMYLTPIKITPVPTVLRPIPPTSEETKSPSDTNPLSRWIKQRPSTKSIIAHLLKSILQT